jgi:hypothetical protein
LKKKKRRPGPAGHQPTEQLRSQIESLAGLGIRREDIARLFQISENTLRKHYRAEIVRGSVMANANVAKSLYRKAVGSGPLSVSTGIFWMKTRGGWRDVNPYPNKQVPVTRPASARAWERAPRSGTRKGAPPRRAKARR